MHPKSKISPRALESPSLFKRMSPRKSVSPSAGEKRVTGVKKHHQSPRLEKKSRSPKNEIVAPVIAVKIPLDSQTGEPDFLGKKFKAVKGVKTPVSLLSNVHNKV